MLWNWQLPQWPQFTYDAHAIEQQEKAFLLDAGKSIGCLHSVDTQDYIQFIVEILSIEGEKSAKIEGEILDRTSLQSSIKRHFGLHNNQKNSFKEAAMADLLCDVYESFHAPLTHDILYRWHERLFRDEAHIEVGTYRTHIEPMQIVSHRYGAPRVFFEAPPSDRVFREMEAFVTWFNNTTVLPILERAAIAHVYFESIHPFEDGNGRIGRLLVEKILSQGIGRPVLIAVSKILEKRRKEYYVALERCNHTLDVSHWVTFFAGAVKLAQDESLQLLSFLIQKSKTLTRLSGQLNARQEKVLLRMFAAGPSGFTGGLSAEKYIKITKTSKATATRDLADLVEKQALVKTGQLRHTRYWLPSNSFC